MIERHIIIDNVDPVTFYGVNNSNIQLIRNLFPKLRMAARGSVITVIGDDSETANFEEKVHALADYCATYNTLPEDVIIDTIKGTPPKQLKMDDVIVYGVNGKPISGRTPNQQLLVQKFSENDLTFALGPAGTGKTYSMVSRIAFLCSHASNSGVFNPASEIAMLTFTDDAMVKFAMNDSWDISWGGADGDASNYGNLTCDSGKDLNVAAGTYHVKLYLKCEGKNYVEFVPAN